jgi:hypothetical protein
LLFAVCRRFCLRACIRAYVCVPVLFALGLVLLPEIAW